MFWRCDHEKQIYRGERFGVFRQLLLKAASRRSTLKLFMHFQIRMWRQLLIPFTTRHFAWPAGVICRMLNAERDYCKNPSRWGNVQVQVTRFRRIRLRISVFLSRSKCSAMRFGLAKYMSKLQTFDIKSRLSLKFITEFQAKIHRQQHEK